MISKIMDCRLMMCTTGNMMKEKKKVRVPDDYSCWRVHCILKVILLQVINTKCVHN